jgi:acyl carrier protein
MTARIEDAIAVINKTVQLLVRDGYFPGELASTALEAGDRLDDLGIDSLGAVAFIAELEKQAGLQVNAEELEQLETIGDLADLLRRSSAP